METAKVGQELEAAQTAIDDALAQTARLMAAMARLRMESNAPPATDAQAVQHMVAALNALAVARTALLAAAPKAPPKRRKPAKPRLVHSRT